MHVANYMWVDMKLSLSRKLSTALHKKSYDAVIVGGGHNGLVSVS